MEGHECILLVCSTYQPNSQSAPKPQESLLNPTDLPGGRTPAEVAAVLIHTRPAVPARVTRALVRRQQLLKSLQLILQTINLTVIKIRSQIRVSS